MNIYYKTPPQQRRTWQTPGGEVKNEIDQLICNDKNIIQDSSVLTTINIGSDHRMLRAKVRINTQKEKRKLIISGNKRIKGEEIKRQKTRYANIVQEQIQEYGMHMKHIHQT